MFSLAVNLSRLVVMREKFSLPLDIFCRKRRHCCSWLYSAAFFFPLSRLHLCTVTTDTLLLYGSLLFLVGVNDLPPPDVTRPRVFTNFRFASPGFQNGIFFVALERRRFSLYISKGQEGHYISKSLENECLVTIFIWLPAVAADSRTYQNLFLWSRLSSSRPWIIPINIFKRMKRRLLQILFLLAAVWVHQSTGYGRGAPDTACSSMLPRVRETQIVLLFYSLQFDFFSSMDQTHRHLRLLTLWLHCRYEFDLFYMLDDT